MLSSCLRAGVDLSIDLTLKSIDHHAVFLEVAFKKQHTEQQGWRRKKLASAAKLRDPHHLGLVTAA